jgi:tRNA(Arg) A34 adenosine deaminase TadA
MSTPGNISFSPSAPSSELLANYAPLSAWRQAQRQAQRSPMGYYRTGAVLIDHRGEIISMGCSHPSPDGQMASTHAERHCLGQAANSDLRRSLCLLYTRSARSGGCAWTSRPCYNCAWALAKRGVQAAIYPRRTESGLWTIEVDRLDDLSAPAKGRRRQRFARALAR